MQACSAPPIYIFTGSQDFIFFSSKNVGEIAATLFIINPVTATLSLFVLTDVLFLFLFIIGFYLAIKINNQKIFWRIFLVSVFFILAIYVRGMGIFALPIFIVPLLVARVPFKQQLRLIGIILLFIAISVTPWIIRNYVKVGVASFNSFESVNMSWSIPKFLAVINGTNEGDEIIAFQKATGVPDSAWQDLSWHDIRYSKQISAIGRKAILDHPFSYLEFHLITSTPFLFPSSILFARDAYDSVIQNERPFVYGSINSLTTGDWKGFFQGILKDWWKLAERIGWLIALIIAFYGIWRDRRNHLVWVFVFIVGYLMLLSGPAAGPRLSFQAWPFIFILFASGGVSIIKKLKIQIQQSKIQVKSKNL